MIAANCTCIIRHALTAEERAAVSAGLEEARRTGDSTGITIALAQLDVRSCPASGTTRENAEYGTGS